MFSDVSYLFEFPFAIEKEGIEFSSITPNIRKSIIYAGDESTGVILDLFALGNVVNPVIYDVLKRTFIKLKMTLLEGDRIIINTNVGEKGITLIRNGVSYNAMGYMSHDSTWLTLEAGDNVYAYDTEGDNSNLQLTIRTTELYGGV